MPDSVAKKPEIAADVEVAFDGGTVKFALPLRKSDHIQRYIDESRSFYEQSMLEHAASFLSPGDLVLDIGACIGNHSLFFAKVCGAQVLAFEPNPEAFATLLDNLRLNDATEVTAFPHGLGASSSRARVLASRGNQGMARLELVDDGAVEVRTIDDLDLPAPPRLLKIDVEGMEVDVLRGGAKTIERHQPLLYIECATPPHFARVAALLEEWNYAATANLNATPTILFVPSSDTPAALNAQIAYLQYGIAGQVGALTERLRKLGQAAARDGRSLEELKRLQRSVEEQHERTVGALSANVQELQRAVGRLDAQLSQVHEQNTRALDELQRMSRLLELQRRPLVDKATRKYRKLRNDPGRFLADSAAFAALARLARDDSQRTPRTAAGRRLRKLRRDPEAFFRDAKNPTVRRVGLQTVRRLGTLVREEGQAISSQGTASMTAMPVKSVVVPAFGAQLPPLDRLADLATLLPSDTELIVGLHGQHIAAVPDVLSALPSHPARLYVFGAGQSVRQQLEYLVARSYANTVAFVSKLDASTSEEVAAALSGTTRARGGQGAVTLLSKETLQPSDALDEALGSLSAPELAKSPVPLLFPSVPYQRPRLIDRLSVLRDRRCVVVGGSLSRLTEALETAQASCDHVELVDVTAFPDFFVYSAPPVSEPFSSRLESADVVCLERQPPWFRAVRKIVSKQSQKVSVIMTCHDAEDTVGAAIDSVLDQSYSNLELIVVDDCSRDGSLAEIRRKAAHDRRVRVLQTPKNSGTYVAKNIGLLAATGALVTFQDSDDLSLGHRLELQVGALEAMSETPAVCVRYQRLDDRGRPLWFGGVKNRWARITLLFRREEVLRSLGFFDSVRMGADEEFVGRLQAITGSKVPVLNAVGYVARHAPGSLTTSGPGAILASEQGAGSMPPVRRRYWEAATDYHARIAQDQASPYMPFPLLRRPFPAPGEISPTREDAPDQWVTASMATMPSRAAILERVVTSILPQVDRLNVYLNGFEVVPDVLQHPKVRTYRSQDTGDHKDNGKFFAVGDVPEGYHFTIDDDIEYPPDYVQRTILKIEEYGRRAAVGVHGVNLAEPLERYSQGRQVFHFKEELARDEFVQLIGTGTLAYHTSTLDVSFEAFRTTGVADLWFAIQARQQGVPLVAQARRKGWLVPIEHEGETIFAQAKVDDAAETAIAHDHGPWTAKAFESMHRELAVATADGRHWSGLSITGGNVNSISALRQAEPIRFSLIIPGWNCAEEVERCWKSVVEQQPGHYTYEAFFLDDGSTDGTWERLCALPERDNIHLRRHAANRGPAYSRYSLLGEIEGGDRVCVLLDLDDLLMPQALSRLAEVYLEDPQCWLTSGNWHNQDRKRNPLDFYDESVVARRAYRQVPYFRCAPLRSFRRHLADALRPDCFQDPAGNWLMHCTDVALMIPLLEQCGPENVRYLHEPLYVYTERRDSGTLRRFGKPKKIEMYRWICRLPPITS